MSIFEILRLRPADALAAYRVSGLLPLQYIDPKSYANDADYRSQADKQAGEWNKWIYAFVKQWGLYQKFQSQLNFLVGDDKLRRPLNNVAGEVNNNTDGALPSLLSLDSLREPQQQLGVLLESISKMIDQLKESARELSKNIEQYLLVVDLQWKENHQYSAGRKTIRFFTDADVYLADANEERQKVGNIWLKLSSAEGNVAEVQRLTAQMFSDLQEVEERIKKIRNLVTVEESTLAKVDENSVLLRNIDIFLGRNRSEVGNTVDYALGQVTEMIVAVDNFWKERSGDKKL